MKKLWKTKDGQILKIGEITDSHLLNIEAMMLRSAQMILNNALSYYPMFQGEMAQYCAEQDWDRMNEMDAEEYAEEIFGEKWDWITDEIIKRGLKRKS